MNTRTLFLGAAALAVVACSASSKKTTLCGTTPAAIDSVGIVIDGVLDTTIAVVDSSFSIDLPVSLENLASVRAEGLMPVMFVSDGSKISIDLRQVRPEAVSSSEKSATSALSSMFKTISEARQSFREATEAQQDSIYAVMVENFKNLVKDNADNIVGVQAFKQIYYELEPEEAEQVIALFSEPIQNNAFIKSAKEKIAVKKATAEGNKFVDFKVETVVSIDKKGEPTYKTDSLSNYVGKGKVMLVDFWSPWCAPCRAEIPNIKAIYDKYHGEDFDALSVAVWEESRRMNYKNTIDTAAVLGVNWNQLNNGHKEPAELYGIEGIPHIILFDKDGTIIARGLRGEELEKAVAQALGR